MELSILIEQRVYILLLPWTDLYFNFLLLLLFLNNFIYFRGVSLSSFRPYHRLK